MWADFDVDFVAPRAQQARAPVRSVAGLRQPVGWCARWALVGDDLAVQHDRGAVLRRVKASATDSSGTLSSEKTRR
jgi:hypothetical protein